MKKITYTILALLALACLGVIIELILWGKIKKNEINFTSNQSEITESKKEETYADGSTGERYNIERPSLDELREYASGTTVIVSSANAKQGDEVILAVTVINNPGILGMSATLSFDENVMTLASAEKGEAFGDTMELTHSATLGSGCVFLWDGLDLEPEQILDGDLLYLKFKLSDSAPSGKYPVSFVLDMDGVYDKELALVNVTVENGYITIS